MATWAEFEKASPELAKIGNMLLIKKGRGYLGTTRPDGAPRVQAICPVLAEGILCASIIRATPKHGDLMRDGRYILHAPLAEGDTEFWIQGHARMLPEAEMTSIFTAHPAWRRPTENSLFTLDISAVHGTIFRPGPDKVPIPDRRTFRATNC